MRGQLRLTVRRGRSTLVVGLMMTLAVLAGVLMARMITPSHTPAEFAQTASFDVASAFGMPTGSVAQTGGLTVLTSEAGNEDLLVLLDARNEELFVYKTDLKGGMQLLQRYPVAQLFSDARARTIGGP